MNDARIRPYTPRDLARVLQIWEAASRTGHPFLSDSFIAAERDKVRDVYLPMAATWVYEENDSAVGFISLIENEVGALFVEPQSHRRGIGGALMQFAIARHPALVLEVFKENASARTFYERCGFVLTSEYRHAETGRLMLRMRYEPGGGTDSSRGS